MDDDDRTIPPELMAALQHAADQAAKGIRDPEAMRLACEDMDRLSEEIFQREGLLDIGVPAIRALRDGEDEACIKDAKIAWEPGGSPVGVSEGVG